MRGPGNQIHHEFLGPPETEFFNSIGRKQTFNFIEFELFE